MSGESSELPRLDLGDYIAQSGGRPSAIVTVAEVATFADELAMTHVGADETEIEDLRNPLLRSLHCLQHFGRAYRIGTHTPMAEPTYMRFQPEILFATCEAAGSDAPTLRGSTRLSHENARDRPPAVARGEEIEQWLKSVQLLAAGDPTALVEERLLEAERLAMHEGNFGACVVEAALAAETLLDGTLGLLLWERDGGAPNSDGEIDRASLVPGMGEGSRPRLGYARDRAIERTPICLDRTGVIVLAAATVVLRELAPLMGSNVAAGG